MSVSAEGIECTVRYIPCERRCDVRAPKPQCDLEEDTFLASEASRSSWDHHPLDCISFVVEVWLSNVTYRQGIERWRTGHIFEGLLQ